LEQDLFAGGLATRLSGTWRNCATALAIDRFALAGPGDEAAEKVEKLLIRRKAQLDRLRRQMRLRAMLEVWLFIHVPATIALLAALAAHIISVFFYW
jgi:hypothetical protein